MNYRHHFHAGNFADLVKHAALLAVLDRLLADPAPLLVIDTHAGAGGYDVPPKGEGAAAWRLRDEDAPPRSLEGLKGAMVPDGDRLFYPGSPLLIAERLRPRDRFVACELRPDDGAELQRRLGARAGLQVLEADGYGTAAARLKQESGRTFVLVDPPFERADDYQQVLELLAARRRAEAAMLVWLPLKDLETFDRFLRAAEAQGASGTVAEVRLRPLTDPMRMNGCAVLVVGAVDVTAALEEACEWVVRTFGEPGGEARVWRL